MRLPRLLLPLLLGACDGKATTDTACDGLDAWPDDDGDGWGDALRATSTCESGANLVDQGGDCDDGDAAVGPGAEESCNGRDDDCDGEIDESPVDGRTWYLDLDGDGEGDPATAVESCAAPTGAVETATDCDDTCASCNNDGAELCGNGLDEDCDGADGVCDEGEDWRGDAVADMRLFGELADDLAGSSLANIGDVDLDGGDDLAVSAIGRDGHTGLVYLAAGLPTGASALADHPALQPNPEAPYYTGWPISGGRDLDGDGWVDLLVASRESDGLSFLYVIDGPLVASEEVSAAARLVLYSDNVNDMTTSQTLGAEGGPVLAVGGGHEEDGGGVWIVSPAGSGSLDLDASDAPYLSGSKGSATGSSVASDGDVDGDGVDDLLISANNGASPATWLVLGPVTTSAALADRGSALASPTWDPATELAIIGDANGDGLDDVLLGAPGSYYDASWGTGRAWLVCDWASTANLDDATATLDGSQTVSFAGSSVASLGDVDGDGAADLLVADEWQGGNVYLVSGRVEGAHPLSEVAMQTFSADADDDLLGRSILVGADVDGDGWQDLVLGGPGASADRGAVWVYLGFGG